MIRLASRMPRPEWAPPPNFTMSVSWVMMRTLSIGTSYHSVTSCAKLVSWPWPCELVPITTSIAAVRVHRHLGALARHAGRGVEIIGDRDAAMLAAPARGGAAGREAVPVAQR